MGLGLLHGSPNHHLSPDWYATGEKLAYWIEREIPSFERRIVPTEYTEALVTVLRKHRVPSAISRDAFSKLEKKGVRFDLGRNAMFLFHAREAGLLPPPATNKIGIPQPPNTRPIRKGERSRIDQHTVEELERRYVLAIKTNNIAGAESILIAGLKLVWTWLTAHGEALQAARSESMVEWEEFSAAVDNAFNPGMLRTHIRYISREEFKLMRNAPTPDFLGNVTIRIASRITTRTVPSSRRVRK